MPTPTTTLALLKKIIESTYIGSDINYKLHQLESVLESEARAHREEVERLTHDLSSEQHARRALRDDVHNLTVERDNANLVAETAGRELKRHVEQGYAREAKLTSDLKDARSNLSRHFENVCKERDEVRNATNRMRQVVRETLSNWRNRGYVDGTLARVDWHDVEDFGKAVEATAQPMADEAAGNAGVTREEKFQVAVNAFARAVHQAQEVIVVENDKVSDRFYVKAGTFINALIAAVREAQ